MPTQYEGRDETCPVSTGKGGAVAEVVACLAESEEDRRPEAAADQQRERPTCGKGTRRVQLVREEGRDVSS